MFLLLPAAGATHSLVRPQQRRAEAQDEQISQAEGFFSKRSPEYDVQCRDARALANLAMLHSCHNPAHELTTHQPSISDVVLNR